MDRASQGIAGNAASCDEEQLLLAGLRAGEERAYEQLVRQYGGRLLAVARRVVGNEEEAADAVQDAFLAAFRAMGSFEGGSRLGTWLHRIVVNASLMKLRRRKRKPEVAIEDLLPQFIEDGHQATPAVEWRPAPAAVAESRETCAVVRSAIDRLPESHRTVLLLRDIEGLDTEETARLLDSNPNTVKVRLHRARQALRALLDPHFRGENQ